MKVILKKGRERSVLRKHPWIFSGAIDKVEGIPQAGNSVQVLSFEGQALGCGAFSPHSQIRVRLWTFDEKSKVDESFFEQKMRTSIEHRTAFGVPQQTNAYRIISAEADGLPGLVVDRYDEFLVCQFLSTGADFWKKTIVNHLISLTGISNVYERSDGDVRHKEGLKPVTGVLSGRIPPAFVDIKEHDIKYGVDIQNGHKTGFYLDQRENRHLVSSFSSGADVLNCFAYTGGFGLAALKGGAAHVTNVEDRAEFLQLIERNGLLNNFRTDQMTNVKADVFQQLRQYVKENRSFDVIILDPPKFADSQAKLSGASRGYKDINLLAFKLLRPGGFLFTFSCSGLITMDLFQKIVAGAAMDSGRDIQILQWLAQSKDHPIKMTIPESHYLKGLLVRVF